MARLRAGRRVRVMERMKRWLTAKRLEIEFYRCFVRLGPGDRRRVARELALPFRRQWYVVDVNGVRTLGDE